jgi:hypothetical protein
VHELENLIDSKEISNIKTYEEKCDGIKRMLTRDRMKVVFFGRTSNGKSTLINAMLRDKILPTGIGHTTNCFLQVEGIENAIEPCIYIPENDEAHDIKVNNFCLFNRDCQTLSCVTLHLFVLLRALAN